MNDSPFTFWLGHLIGYSFFFGMFVMGAAFVEEFVGVVTPYEPVILRSLASQNRTR
jgi:hypothetical protein